MDNREGDRFKINGGLAHLVERKHGMFEVTGSIPVSSTTSQGSYSKCSRLFLINCSKVTSIKKIACFKRRFNHFTVTFVTHIAI